MQKAADIVDRTAVINCSYASGRATELAPFQSVSEEFGGPAFPACGFRSDRSGAEVLDDELVGVFVDGCAGVRPLNRVTGSNEPSSAVNSVAPATLTLLPRIPSFCSPEAASLLGTWKYHSPRRIGS